jgi:RNA polymerase sigma-70 factor (ECF subfamily)
MTQDADGRMTHAAGRIDHVGLLRRCAERDSDALRRLFELEGPTMLGVATRILRRRELAEEAVQDAFVQIWRKAATYDPDRGVARAWIFAILRHRALNILRDGAREDLAAELPEPVSDDPDPEAVVSRLSDESRLRGCLEALEPRRRAGIVLAYTHGLSHGEVAERLSVPLGTAKSWIRRGLAALKECMG